MRRLSPAVAGVAGWVLRLAFFGALAVIAAGLYIGLFAPLGLTR